VEGPGPLFFPISMSVVVVGVKAVIGEIGTSGFVRDDSEPLPLFEEPGEEETAVRPELEPDEPEIGIVGTWMPKTGIGIGSGKSLSPKRRTSFPFPILFPLGRSAPRIGVVGGVGWGVGPGVGFTTTTRGGGGGVASRKSCMEGR
jgi:hypothetical protein